MRPKILYNLLSSGKKETYKKGQVFYSLDFKEELFLILEGYVKRCQVKDGKRNVIESIYGPGYYFPLSQVYKTLLNYDLNQEHITYTYEAMSDVTLAGIHGAKLAAEAEKKPEIYKELFFEAGRRLNANINRLASNNLTDDYQKIAHQLVCLADEFGEAVNGKNKGSVIRVPMQTEDMADQLNTNPTIATAIVDNLIKQDLVKKEDGKFIITNLHTLRDSYL